MKLPDVTGKEKYFEGSNGLAEHIEFVVGSAIKESLPDYIAFRKYNHRLAAYQAVIENYLTGYASQNDKFDLNSALEKLTHTANLIARKAALELGLDKSPDDIARHLEGEKNLLLASRRTALWRPQFQHLHKKED